MIQNNGNVNIAFNEASKFLSDVLQTGEDMLVDISFYEENQRALNNAEITGIMRRLGESVKRYGQAIFFYNLIIEAVNFANPNKEQIAKQLYRPIQGAYIYQDDLERLNMNLPYLAVIRIVAENGTQAALDKVIDWLMEKLGISWLHTALVKEHVHYLLSKMGGSNE